MKRFILAFAFLGLICAPVLFTQCTTEESYGYEGSATSGRRIDVWRITGGDGNGAVISSKTKGIYHSDDHTITISGDTYNVKDNPRYSDGTTRGRYEYYAGGIYYFNL